MSGYTLPGVQLTDVTDIQTASSSSSQRVPCFIGTASTVKSALNEEVLRASVGYTDNLENYSTGITSIIKSGTQKGLSDLVEGTDFSLNYSTGEITWLIHTETREISGGVYGLELFNSITPFSSFGTAVGGTAETVGYQGVGLDVISSANSGLALGTLYDFKVNNVNHSFVTSSTGTVVTVGDVADLMNTSLINTAFTVSFVTSDIIVSTVSSGAGNTVALSAGTSNDLFAALSGWTAHATAHDGTAATHGRQALGLNVLTGDDTGLSTSSRYYFKVNGLTYSILTGSSTVSYTNLVSLLDGALTSVNIDVTFSNGDVVFTNSTTGTSSIVELSTAEVVTAVNNQLTIQLATNTIFGRKPGKVAVTCTVNAKNYTFGIADDVNPGDGSVVLSGSVADLNMLLIGTSLTFTTIPAVSGGGKYYISYTYNRPSSDYTYKTFTSYSDLKNDLGECIPANQLVMMGSLAFEYFGVPRIACIQVPASNQNSDYVAALQLCKNRDIQTLGVLNSSATVRSAVITHVNERNLPTAGKWRMYYTGPSTGTLVGDINTPDTIANIASSIKNESIVFNNVHRAKFYYFDATTQSDVAAVVDGAFVGAAIGAFRDSFAYPSQNLLRYTIPGLELYAEDFDDYYSDDALIAAGTGSAFLVSLGNNNSVFVKDDLTTNNTSVESNNINIITAKHYIAKDVSYNLDKTFIGKLITNRVTYKTNVEIFMMGLFKNYKSAKIIENVNSITVELPTARRDTVKVSYSYFAVYTNKYIEGEYSIAI